jgi:hypothetical protein
MRLKMIFLFFLWTVGFLSFGQDYYEDTELRYENHIYREEIKTVQVHLNGNPISSPILELNDTKQLLLSFDDVSRELKDYYYTYIHCDANWQPSDLMPNEYIEGMQEDLLFETQYSYNTFQSYLNHSIVFPNENLKITKSGNYIIYIYEDADKEKPVLTYRFMVTENLITVNASVNPGGGGADRLYKQSIDFSLIATNYELTNPYDNLKVYIMQNLRWDNMLGPIDPAFVKGAEIEYGIGTETTFEGGNEFRLFNTTDLNFISEGIERNTRDAKGASHVYLEQNKKRSYQVYLERRDINGKYYIKNTQYGDNPDTEADYAYVHFKLKAEQPYSNNVYVLGQLSHWKLDPNYKMNYNQETKQYEATLFLKQGLYNYMYVMQNNDGMGINLEGAHFATENDYYILTYHSGLSDRYDRLIAVKTLNSKRDF